MLQANQRSTQRPTYMWALWKAKIPLQIDAKLTYALSNNQLHSTGYNLFAFL